MSFFHLTPLAAAAETSSLTAATTLFHQGKFVDVIALADAAAVDAGRTLESWLVLKAKSELATGNYQAAKQTISTGVEKLPFTIQLRWLGESLSQFHNDPERANQIHNEIASLIEQKAWRFRNVPDQMVVAKFRLASGADAKRILDEVYTKAKKLYPELPEPWLAVGQLGLDKNDYDLAATNFAEAIKLDPGNPMGHYGRALAYRPSDPEQVQASINAALEIDGNHVPTLLVVVETQLAAEAYDDASRTIDQIVKVHPDCPEAWAFRAVLAHLENKPQRESECRQHALQHGSANPQVDHLIGQELSKKYRFQEGSDFQRRALKLDPDFRPAQMQLAHDLLRLGQELEGWRMAETVFDADQYNVVANNLVALRDNMSEYASAEQNGFVIRMAKNEFDAYGHLVFDLVEEAAAKLTKKYDVELQKPIFIEIFPRQQDFAIRTFGVPGGAGFLGVCFGRVVTMNSPVAQGATQTNWRSVLWHEFCHVVTLQKTKNKMPRWLSEGISVYEERLANNAWGDSINPSNREMILSGELTPVSKLSSAFLNPKSGQHLRFAYYESSLVVRFLVEKFGEPAMADLLDDLARGTTINDALGRHMAPTEQLDKTFEAYATDIAKGLAPKADWTRPEKPIADLAGWRTWLQSHPNNYFGLLGSARELIASQEFDEGLAALDELASLYGDADGAEAIYRLRAAAFRGQRKRSNADTLTAETTSLEKAIELDANDLASCSRLLSIYASAGQWDEVRRVANRVQGINPMLRNSHASMAMAAERTGDDPLLIQELKVLLSLGPFDRADAHYRLAAAEFRSGDGLAAKRNVLLSLEAAPRFRDAHILLLEIIASLESTDTTRDQP